MKSFSIKAFVLASVAHFAGTILFVWLAVSIVFENVFTPTPLWLDILGWIWVPVPMLLSHIIPNYIAYQTYASVLWSLCVGIIVGLVVRHPSMLRRRIA